MILFWILQVSTFIYFFALWEYQYHWFSTSHYGVICVWAFLFVRFACSRHLKFSCRITSTSITFFVECFGLFMLEFYPNGSMVIMVYIYIYTWNPNDLYFWRATPQNKAEIPIKTRGPIWVPGIPTFTIKINHSWIGNTRNLPKHLNP